MDVGLLLTVLIVLGGVQVTLRAMPPTAVDRAQVVEMVSTPLIVGLISARVVFVLLDHPASVFRLRDLMVVRAGVEFWAGVFVALAWVLVRVRRSVDRGGAMVALAAAMPYLLIGVALYEASCLVRDGCLGPIATVGLKPNGLGSTMVPVGVLVAGVLAIAALVVRNAWTLEAEQTVLCAFAVLGGVRLVASWFLPAFGPSRVERESALVFAVSLSALVVRAMRRRRARRAAFESDSGSDRKAVDNNGGDVTVS